MNCDELLKALNEYVDGAELTVLCEEYAEHLAGCNPCQIVIDNIRQTISLYKAGKPYDMPSEFQQKMQARLKQHWEEKFGPTLNAVGGD
jgi:F420-dependent methylenetetrahydromethanopterin dehydrogenase